MTENSNYSIRAMQVLGSFQLLEFALKTYVAACYGVVNAKLGGSIPFRYNFKSIENFPLEKLLSSFAQLNDNVSLQKRLNGLRERRNDIAHRALLYRHEVIRDLLAADLTQKSVDLNQTASEVDECLGLMALELEHVLGEYNAAKVTNGA